MSTINPLLIESFLRDGKKAVEIIGGSMDKNDFLNAENIQQYRITVHGIKSSLRNVGEHALSDVAEQLEDAGRSGDLDVIHEKTAGFLTRLQEVLEKMQPEQIENLDGDDPPDIQDRLSELKQMCEDYDRRGALQVIAGITVCTAETRATLDAVKELVQQSDFEEAEALL